MKRFLSLVLAAGLALSLCACGDVLVDLDTPKSGELSAQYDFYPDSMNTIRADMQITPEQADDVFIALVSCGLDGKISTVSEYKQHNFLLDCDVKTADVKSGSGDVIGQRAFVSVLKSQLAELTAENFAEFAETIVKDSGYNYFTIKCDDGTGIVFPGSMCYVSHYCQLDDDGAMLENYGTITLDENGVCNYESSETSNEIKSLVLSVIPAEYQDKPSFSVDVLSQSDGGYSVTIQIDVDSAEYRSIANDIYNDFVALPNSNLSVHTFDFLIVSDGALIDNFSLPE